jgi:hypothetical protein
VLWRTIYFGTGGFGTGGTGAPGYGSVQLFRQVRVRPVVGSQIVGIGLSDISAIA